MIKMKVARALMERAMNAKQELVKISSGAMDLPPLISVRLGNGTVHAGQVTEQWTELGEVGIDPGTMLSTAIRQLWVAQGHPMIHEIQFISEGYHVLVSGDLPDDKSLAELFEKGDSRVGECLSAYVIEPDGLGSIDCWVISQPYTYPEDKLYVLWDEQMEFGPDEMHPKESGSLLQQMQRLIYDTERER